MKFEIKNRWSGNVQFTADIECGEDAPRSLKIGLAVKWAVEARADLSGADLSGADLSGADLSGAYLSGAYLSGADLAGANLADANLARANLADANLAGADLADANLARADLARADLAGADLAGADLAGANLSGADLAGADLAGALKIDPADIPVIPQIDAVILKAIEEGGKLQMSAWHGPNDHWCGTTHCRGGWAVHFGGEKGKALQDRVGPQIAATLIYHASRPDQPAPHFFASDADALADIKRCAAEQELAA